MTRRRDTQQGTGRRRGLPAFAACRAAWFKDSEGNLLAIRQPILGS